MKLLAIALFVALETGIVAAPAADTSMPRLFHSSPDWTEDSSPSEYSVPSSLVSRAEDVDRVYYLASCKGQKLLAATTSPRDVAAAYVTPIDSPWVNPIMTDLTTWGYKLDSDDGTPQWRASHFDECEFQTNHKLKR
ncbi:hypothetical protein PtrEW13061_011527, partial [Pyrenophora tritici-repentis]